MLAEGRGERLTPVTPMPRMPVVICKPDFPISTPELFRRVDARTSRCRPDTEGICAALADGDMPRLARRMYNVFEDVLTRREGEIASIKSRLLDGGALGAVMSGTGSAVFGLFADADSAAYAKRRLARDYAECFSFMGYAPIIFISAQTGYNVNKLMQLIRDVDAENGARVPTGVLNEMLARATARMQPPSDKGRRLKIYYLTQASTRPPTFVAFVNAKHLFHFSYQRYLINQIRENFGLEHTPIRLVVRERGSGEVGAKDV